MRKTTSFFSMLCFLVLFCAATFAQEKTVSGSVTDQAGLPLPGVNILVKGTARGTQSDFDGKFTVSASPSETLVFSYVGLMTVERLVGDASYFEVQMEEDPEALEEVIVIAYGTATKESYTGSVSTVSAETLDNRPLTNALQGIEGAAAGLQISPGSGQPGAGPAIRVRGFGSVNSSQSPLFVVDGVIYSGDFSSINSSDIESMTVLKDAASTALYGSQGANGVVIITTKRGKVGKSQATVEISQGVISRGIPEYDRVNAGQYYELIWEALRNSLVYRASNPLSIADANIAASASTGVYKELGYNPFNVPNDQIVGTDGKLNPSASLLYPDDLDWEEALDRLGTVSNVNFSFQGASEITDYFVSLNYLNQTANVINSDFERINARINLNSKLTSWLKTGLNINATSSESNQAVDGAVSSTAFVNPFRFSRVIAPIYPVFLHDPVTGAFVLDSEGNKIYDEGTTVGMTRAAGGSPGRHPIQENLLNVDRDKIFSFNSRAYAEITFLKDFTFTANAALDKRYFNNENYDNKIVGDGAPDGRAGRDASTITVENYNQLLNYKRSFGVHTVEALLGHESLKYELNFLTGFRQKQVVDGNTELINFATTVDLDSYSRDYSKEGYFSRLNYDYDNKYFVSGSYRRDGSSRFNEDARWGDFYSVSGAWRIDNENFMGNLDWINFLKLRGSYGQVGNDSNLSNASLSFYASQSLLGLGNNNAGEPGILISAPGNELLEWETQKQTDLGLDFGFLKDRISGSVGWYKKTTDGLIFEVPLPVSSGLDSYPANIGNMFNRGLEIDLNLGLINNDSFKWDLNVNASTIHNEFTELPQEEIINGTKKYVVGGSIFDYWLRDWYGVDPADGAGLFVLDTELGADGDADVRTIDGSLVTTNINKALFDFVGTALPDLFGSFTNTFTYKNFEFRTLFTYQLGGETYDTNYAQLLSSGTYGVALSTDALRRWQQPGDITDIPRMDNLQTANFGTASDRFLVSSTFLGWRQASLAYNIDSGLSEKLGINSAKIYLNGENLYFWTKRKGLDVGQNFNGTTQNRFVPSRIITLGLNLTF